MEGQVDEGMSSWMGVLTDKWMKNWSMNGWVGREMATQVHGGMGGGQVGCQVDESQIERTGDKRWGWMIDICIDRCRDGVMDG